MRLRFLGRTGIQVSAISFGAMLFGGAGSGFFRPVGTTELEGARQQVDLCLEAGVNLFDTADVYSDGRSEEILGGALSARRPDVLVATRLHGLMGGPNDRGQSRHHIVRAVHASLRRLRTDWIDVLQVHGCSSFSAWHLMKALAIAERDTSSATASCRPTTRSSPASSSTSWSRSASTRASVSSSGAPSRAASLPERCAAERAPRRARGRRSWARRGGWRMRTPPSG